MKRKMKYLLIIVLSLICGMIYSQNPIDSVNGKPKKPIPDSKFIVQMDSINVPLQIKYDELVKTDSIKSLELNKKETEINEMAEKIDSYLNQIAKVDTALIEISSNFIYIPYEAYSIDKIAIPAFNLVSNKGFKDQYKTRLILLESYDKDIKSLHSFLLDINVDLSNPYAKGDVSKPLIQEMKGKSFYIQYSKFDDFTNTFLGKKFIEIENRLDKHDRDKYKANFDDIIEELNNCLKTKNDL